MSQYIGDFMVFSGTANPSLAEKVADYVKSVGFTDADIAKFREIMLEK